MTLPFLYLRRQGKGFWRRAGELGYNKCFEYSAIQGTRGTIGVMLLYGEEEEVEDKFIKIIRVNIKMELEKNGFKVKEVL